MVPSIMTRFVLSFCRSISEEDCLVNVFIGLYGRQAVRFFFGGGKHFSRVPDIFHFYMFSLEVKQANN